MNRIYLILMLFITSVSSAFAQNVDLKITHLWSKTGAPGTYVQFSYIDTILKDGYTSYYYNWIIENQGPDSLIGTDSILIRSDWGTTYSVQLQNVLGKGLEKDSTVTISSGSSPIVLIPGSHVIYPGFHPATWCDSMWAKRDTTIIYELDTTNNKICTNLTVLYYVDIDDVMKTADEAFLLYPNPATHALNLKFDFGANTPATVHVVDMTGKLVHTEDLGVLSGFKDLPLHLTKIPQGLYVVKLITDKGIFTDRLTIY